MKIQNTKVFQIIKTPAVNPTEEGFDDVYSLLEINCEGGCTETAFYYDISRIRSRAEEILRAVERSERTVGEVLEEIL